MSSRPPAQAHDRDPIGEAHRQWVAHGWGDAADGMALITAVTRVQQLFQQRIDDALRPFDLTFARYEILMLLTFSREGALPLRIVGSRLQVHPTSVTSALDRLERQGFVVREQHPTDRRSKLARLTEDGRTVAKAATVVLNDEVFAAPGPSEEELPAIAASVDRLRRSLGGGVGD